MEWCFGVTGRLVGSQWELRASAMSSSKHSVASVDVESIEPREPREETEKMESVGENSVRMKRRELRDCGKAGAGVKTGAETVDDVYATRPLREL